MPLWPSEHRMTRRLVELQIFVCSREGLNSIFTRRTNLHSHTQLVGRPRARRVMEKFSLR